MTAEENPRGKGHVVSARNQYSKPERSMRLLFFISGSSSVSHRSFFGVHAFFWGVGASVLGSVFPPRGPEFKSKLLQGEMTFPEAGLPTYTNFHT